MVEEKIETNSVITTDISTAPPDLASTCVTPSEDLKPAIANGSNAEGITSEDRSREKGGRGEDRDDVCRDFLKNICNRGSRCKFYHPPETQVRNDETINFCIDYQNRGCMRDNCRFVHAAREEVERYKHTREVTLPLARAIAAVTQGDSIAGIPVCKEFQSGKCARGAARCRYWHVNIEEERDRRLRGLPPSGGPGGRFGGPIGGNGRFCPPGPMFGGPVMPGMRRPGPALDGPFEKRPRIDDQRIMDLERKNAELMKELEVLKRELQREHERYEDLYALFRQQGGLNVGAVPVPTPPMSKPGAPPSVYAPYGGWNSSAMSGWQ
ncbi:unnamed protein product [Auanema sp. JU1783]|nr:unnamed protein product [Auanema sp. JU1783]